MAARGAQAEVVPTAPVVPQEEKLNSGPGCQLLVVGTVRAVLEPQLVEAQVVVLPQRDSWVAMLVRPEAHLLSQTPTPWGLPLVMLVQGPLRGVEMGAPPT